MADVDKAIAFVIGLEDDKKIPGCITALRGDTGGKTRLGIAERFHPDLAAKGFFDGDLIDGESNPQRWKPTTIDESDGMELAVETYREEYAKPLRISDINSPGVAARVLGFGVNEGLHQAVVNVQRCLPGLVADGVLGDKTLAAINAAVPNTLLVNLRAEQESFYQKVAAANPNLAQYANGMKNRADA